MKKFESQLGHLTIFSESMEDLIQNMEYDSVLLMKEIMPVLDRCNLKNPYDCDVQMMLVARVAAYAIANAEGDDYNAENRVRSSFEYYLDCFRDARDGKIKAEVFDVE